MRKEFKDALKCPVPSEEFSKYFNSAFMGKNPDVPVYGKGRSLIRDFYGMDANGTEKARFILPWGQFEKSYFVTRTASGEIKVTDEGFYPRVK